MADPLGAALRAVVAGAARDEAAHRVAHEIDLLDRDRPRIADLLEELVERAAVLGDVAAGVVPDMDRRAPEVAGETGGVCLAARPGAEPPRELRLHEPVQEDREPWRPV